MSVKYVNRADVEELRDKHGFKSAEIWSLSEEDNKFTEAQGYNYPSKTKFTYLSCCKPTIISLPNVQSNSPHYTTIAKAGDVFLPFDECIGKGRADFKFKASCFSSASSS